MPTGTWERLPAERRAAIISAAEGEFAERGFSSGSLNSIARDAKVSKGSLFQYFDDKVDLFAHVAELTSVRIRTAMEAAAADLPWDSDFFGSLRRLNRVWVGYFYDHPIDLALTAAANLEPDRTARNAVRRAAAEQYDGMLRPLVEAAVAAGQFPPDADAEALLALLLLVIPHVALAPHIGGLDVVLGMDGAALEDAIAGSDRLLRAIEHGYVG